MADKRVIILGNMSKPGVADEVEAFRLWAAERVEVAGVFAADGAPPADAMPADL